MRISSISMGNYHCVSKVNSSKKFRQTGNVVDSSCISFKGPAIKSAIGTIIGFGAGMILSGGLAAPLILGMLGTTCGSIKGSIDEAKKHSDWDDDEYTPEYNYGDFIG